MEQTDVVIVGAGLAGISAASECLDLGMSVRLIDRSNPSNWGGLAKKSFGGVMLVDTPHQRRTGIKDSPTLAMEDWLSFAEFGDQDHWPKLWAERYCSESIPDIYEWLSQRGVQFMPVVNWPERGLDRHGNSVPRWHITWGTGHRLIECLKDALGRHRNAANLFTHHVHRVESFIQKNGRIVGVQGCHEKTGLPFEALGEAVILACGGICGGDLTQVRKHWYPSWGSPPENLLNGSHVYADGLLHDAVQTIGGSVTHLEKQWHYAAGVHHPEAQLENHGLSLVPPRSALWCDATGARFGPRPLVGYTDTRHLVETICKAPGQYSWLIMNWKIAIKELAVSGTEYMTAFRERNRLLLLKNLAFGNGELVRRLIQECDDVFEAVDLDGLITGMQKRSKPGIKINGAALKGDVKRYDEAIRRGPKYVTDEQLLRIKGSRRYRGDRIRICNFQKIDDSKALPLIAIRCFILSRKSLGGMQTDLDCRVLNQEGEPIAGLFAAGEAAGFGGGGIHGLRSLEGTFLGACVMTGRQAARSIKGGKV